MGPGGGREGRGTEWKRGDRKGASGNEKAEIVTDNPSGCESFPGCTSGSCGLRRTVMPLQHQGEEATCAGRRWKAQRGDEREGGERGRKDKENRARGRGADCRKVLRNKHVAQDNNVRLGRNNSVIIAFPRQQYPVRPPRIKAATEATRWRREGKGGEGQRGVGNGE